MRIHSLSLCARVTLDLHNLNSEGTEGNQQQTRMVHVIDESGQRQIVNAVSGDMFKHILVGHLTPLLQAAGEPLSEGAAKLNPDRVNADPEFEKRIKGLANSAVLDEVLQKCAVTDIAGTLIQTPATTLGAGLTWHGGLRSARRRLGLTGPPNSPWQQPGLAFPAQAVGSSSPISRRLFSR